MSRASVALAGALLSLPGWLAAQGDCFPPDDSNEAQTMAIFSVPLAYGRLAAPGSGVSRGVWVGLEGSYVPGIDDETATPTICRPGKGAENTDLLFAFPRPRVGITLPGGFALEASWIPPIRVAGVRANLFGFAVGRSFALAGTRMTLSFRAHTTLGSVRAPITCDDDALDDPASECFEGEESDDRFRPNIFGADAAVGWSTGGGRWAPYVGAGYTHLAPRFQVHFVNRVGELDDRRVEVDLDRVALFGGVTWTAAGSVGVTGELYAVPGDAITGRVLVRTWILDR